MLEILIGNNKKINLKAILYITKIGNETKRKITLYFNGAEFERNFYNKKSTKDFLNFLKFYEIPINCIRANYNCSYMDLPF